MKFLLCIFLSLVFLPLAKAAEWKIDAAVKQNISFDDNVRMRENAKGSFIYHLIPSVNFSYKTEVSAIEANIDYGIQRYSSIKELNKDSQRYNLKGYYLTQKSYWGLNLFLGIEPTRNSAEQDSGDFSSDAERIMQSIAPLFSYNLTEIDTLTLSSSYSEISYSTNKFSNYKNSNINFAWEHQWTMRYSNSLSVFYSSFDSISLNDNLTQKTSNKSYGINLSSSYWWSENLQILSTWGIRMTASENTSANDFLKEKSFGFLSDTVIKYKGENYLLTFNLNRSLAPSSRGQLNEQNKIGLNLNYEISERLSTRIQGNYQTSESASSNADETKTRKNLSLQSSLNWKMARDWSVSASYRYQQQDRDAGTPKVASNSFILSINYNWQGLSVAR